MVIKRRNSAAKKYIVVDKKERKGEMEGEKIGASTRFRANKRHRNSRSFRAFGCWPREVYGSLLVSSLQRRLLIPFARSTVLFSSSSIPFQAIPVQLWKLWTVFKRSSTSARIASSSPKLSQTTISLGIKTVRGKYQ